MPAAKRIVSRRRNILFLFLSSVYMENRLYRKDFSSFDYALISHRFVCNSVIDSRYRRYT